MRRSEKLPELLSPAGDFECLYAAVEGGADAVYVGGRAFGARAYAKNFDLPEIKRAVAYCHLHGVRLYVTLNTLLEGDEPVAALKFAEQLYIAGVDALIVTDLGLIRLIRRYLPDMELHASTQMSIHNSEGVEVAARLGLKRVVLARELLLKDISRITEETECETEVFLHGALCVSYSGQCLYSSLVGGRSGNRGECAQPCRLPYSEGYQLSLKDMCLASHIRELIDSGTASLKIEGRMKSPDYVYTVTSVYRRLLDEYRDATADELALLQKAFSRGGFTDGYFVDKKDKGMLGTRSKEDKLLSREIGTRAYEPIPVPVEATVNIQREKRVTLTFKYKGTKPDTLPRAEFTAVFDAPNEALTSPLTPDVVISRIRKLGGTYLSLCESDVTLTLDDGLNLSPAALNGLRRAAQEGLEFSSERTCEPAPYDEISRVLKGKRSFRKSKPTAYFYDTGLAKSLYSMNLSDVFSHVFVPLDKYLPSDGISGVGVCLPPVIFESELAEVRRMLSEAKERGVTCALIGNLGHIPLVREYGLSAVSDFRMNVSNSFARDAIEELVGDDVILSCELSYSSARAIGGRAVIYGRVPLMLTERCFIKDSGGCSACGRAALCDRIGAQFPMKREYRHRNVILNSAITYALDKPTEGINGHFIFTTESASDLKRIIAAYKSCAPLPLPVKMRRMGRREGKKSEA